MEVTHQSRSQDFSMPLHQKAKTPIEQRPTMPEVPQRRAQGSSEGPQLQKPNSYTSLRAVRQRLAAQRNEPVQAKGKQAAGIERETSIREVAASGFSGIAQALPHKERIQKAFGGTDLSGVRAYIGGAAAEACDRMGVQAFTQGDRIAFKETPDMELATHEVAHFMQQISGKVQLAGGVGKVGDRYETHADAVAKEVAAGRSVVSLMQEYTQSVSETQHESGEGRQGADSVVAESNALQLKVNSETAPIQAYISAHLNGNPVRIADDRSMMIDEDDPQTIWAAPGKADRSNQDLGSDAGILLQQDASQTVNVATAEGGEKGLVRVYAQRDGEEGEMGAFLSDCGHTARTVLGGSINTPMQGVYRNGSQEETVPTIIPIIMQVAALEDTLKLYQLDSGQTLLEDNKVRDFRDSENWIALHSYLLNVYTNLDPETQNDLDRRAGINRYANPQVGQAFTIARGTPWKGTGWNFHWGAVVMKSDEGLDKVTLENSADRESDAWFFQMYGSANPGRTPGQTFHEQQSGTGDFGSHPTTLVAEPRA